MAHHKITRGLDLPLAGAPQQTVEPAPRSRRVALLAQDASAFARTARSARRPCAARPDALRGQEEPGVPFTSPAAGAWRRCIAASGARCSRWSSKSTRRTKRRARSAGSRAGRAACATSCRRRSPCAVARIRPVDRAAHAALRPRAGRPKASPRRSSSPPWTPGRMRPPRGGARRARGGLRRRRALPSMLTRRAHVRVQRGRLDLPVPQARAHRRRGVHRAASGRHARRCTSTCCTRSMRRQASGTSATRTWPRSVTWCAPDVWTSSAWSRWPGPACGRPRLLRTRLGACTEELLRGELRRRRAARDLRLGARRAQRRGRGRTAISAATTSRCACLPEGRERELFGWITPAAEQVLGARTSCSGACAGGAACR